MNATEKKQFSELKVKLEAALAENAALQTANEALKSESAAAEAYELNDKLTADNELLTKELEVAKAEAEKAVTLQAALDSLKGDYANLERTNAMLKAKKEEVKPEGNTSLAAMRKETTPLPVLTDTVEVEVEVGGIKRKGKFQFLKPSINHNYKVMTAAEVLADKAVMAELVTDYYTRKHKSVFVKEIFE